MFREAKGFAGVETVYVILMIQIIMIWYRTLCFALAIVFHRLLSNMLIYDIQFVKVKII